MFGSKVPTIFKNVCHFRQISRGRRWMVPMENPWKSRMSMFEDLGRMSRDHRGNRWNDDNLFKSMDNMVHRMLNVFGYPPYVKGRNAAVGEDVQVKSTGKEYKITLDVHQYAPDEVMVKIVDNMMTITAQHEERAEEHGYLSREFTRQFLIPEDVDSESFSSSITEDGSLIVRADMLRMSDAKERTIPITKEETKSGESDREKVGELSTQRPTSRGDFNQNSTDHEKVDELSTQRPTSRGDFNQNSTDHEKVDGLSTQRPTSRGDSRGDFKNPR